MATSASMVHRMLNRIVRRIATRFDPDRILLFGSHARGDAGPDSDVDLLVVMRVGASNREERIRVRCAIHDIHVPKDILVITPDEYEIQKDIPGTIARVASQEGRVLYVRA